MNAIAAVPGGGPPPLTAMSGARAGTSPGPLGRAAPSRLGRDCADAGGRGLRDPALDSSLGVIAAKRDAGNTRAASTVTAPSS